MFGNHLSTPEEEFREEVRREIAEQVRFTWDKVPMELDDVEDVMLANLEGNGAHEVAERWADSGQMKRKLENLVQYLDGKERSFVERILVVEGSDDPSRSSQDDVWVTASAIVQAVKALPKPAAPSRPPGGRANDAETRAADARLRASKRRSRYLPSQSDEETEGECEEDRYRAAYFLFAKQAGLPSPTPDMFPSSSPDRSACSKATIHSGSIEHASVDDAAQTPTAPIPVAKGLVSPISLSAEDDPRPILKIPISPAVATKDSPDTPQRERQSSTLRSPFQLQPSSPASRPRKRSRIDDPSAPVAHAEAVPALQSPEKRSLHSVPFVDLCNLAKAAIKPTGSVISPYRQGGSGTTKDSKETGVERETPGSRGVKRRHIDLEEEPKNHVREEKRVHQDRGLSRPTAQLVKPEEPTPLTTANESSRCTGQNIAASSASTSRSSSRAPGSHPPSESRRALSQGIARTLSKLPPGALEDLRAGRFSPVSTMSAEGLHVEPVQDTRVVPAKALPTPSILPGPAVPASSSKLKFPLELPDSDSQVEPDVEMDFERVKQLESAFRAEYGRGIRPGLVVPRLKCLESQSQ